MGFGLYDVDRLYTNRCAVTNVLADCSITNVAIAKKLEISECDCTKMETLVTLLKPLPTSSYNLFL